MLMNLRVPWTFFFSTGSTAPLGPGLSAFSFMIILQTLELLGRVISSSQGLYLNTGQHKHRINTYTHQTSMPCVGFEPTIPASERAKTVHVLDRSATVTGSINIKDKEFLKSWPTISFPRTLISVVRKICTTVFWFWNSIGRYHQCKNISEINLW
jgi:hypothetical protein